MNYKKIGSKRVWLAAVSATLLAACGSDGDQDSPPPALVDAEVSEAASLPPNPVTQKASTVVLTSAAIVVNGEFSPGLPVRFERSDTPRLEELRNRENLLALVEGSSTEFEAILRVMNWVAAQWPHSTPDPYPPWDAITILDWIRSGRTGGFCGQYAQVMLQSLAALGIVGRYVEIGSVDNPYGHFVMEAWSNDFNKWVVLDADYNTHFELDGVPMSALDLHDALINNESARVVPVLGEFREGHDAPSRWPLQMTEWYYYVRVLLKADHLSIPDELPFDRYNETVEWNDALTVPWELSDVPSTYSKFRVSNLTESNRATFNQRLNQVRVSVTSMSGQLMVQLENNMPDFHHYQISEIYRPMGFVHRFWASHESETFLWKPLLGMSLEIRAIDDRGKYGPATVIDSVFKAAPEVPLVTRD
jgi:hypothetical protein